MAIERYRPGARLPAVRARSPQKGAYRFSSAARKKYYDPSARMFEAMLVFGKAAGRFAESGATPERAATAGLDAVFTWWCQKGPRGTSHDKREVAAQIAADAAEQFGFDVDLVDPIVSRRTRFWATWRCRNGRPPANRTFSPQNDRVPQNEDLRGPEYRFAAMPLMG